MSDESSIQERMERREARDDRRFEEIFQRLSAVEGIVGTNGERSRVEHTALKELVTEAIKNVRELHDGFNTFRDEHGDKISNVRERIVILEDREKSRQWREQTIACAVIVLVVAQSFQLVSIVMRILNKNL